MILVLVVFGMNGGRITCIMDLGLVAASPVPAKESGFGLPAASVATKTESGAGATTFHQATFLLAPAGTKTTFPVVPLDLSQQ